MIHRNQEMCGRLIQPLIVVFSLLLLCAIVVPGRETMRMILVSEFGRAIV
jgi:hypothetical protein